MFIGYKYRIYPNKEQEEFINKSFGCARVVYNYGIDRRVKSYQNKEKSPSQFELCKEVVKLKKTEEYKWLADVNHNTLQCSIQNLDKAFTRFFREKKGFPKFKSKYGKQSCQFIQGIAIDFVNSKIKIPKSTWCKAIITRPFKGKIKTTTITKTVTGKYYITIQVDNELELPQILTIKEENSIGIDIGIKEFATLSTGEKINNPKYLKNSEKRLKVLQKRASRKVKGSNNRRKANKKVALLHEKITNQRRDFLHKLSSKIISENQTIIIEDLNIEGLRKNNRLSKSISDASWGEFFGMLKYKTEWKGYNLIKIGRFEPSSKMCSCGIINQELTLSDRIWTCSTCGVTHDRDILAANNIKRFGLQKQNLIGHSG